MADSWIPEGVDAEAPSVARMYDYFLGGAHNFEVDRRLAKKVIEQFPDIVFAARANRDFVLRAIRHVATMGLDQYLDIGCGLPTANMVHQQARKINPDARVVYVDSEPVAVQHGLIMLADVPGAEIIQADMRDPNAILDHPITRQLLDFDRPVALLLAAVLHFIPDADGPAEVVAGFRDRLAPGSVLILSHGTADGEEDGVARARELYAKSQSPASTRTRAQVQALLAGFDLVEPGLVLVPDWHPEPMRFETLPSSRSHFYGAVGIRPER